MKKIFTIILLLAMYSVANAQGNLQFNRVFFVEHSFLVPSNVVYPYSEITITVPAGKVWKVESTLGTFLNNGAASNPNYGSSMWITLNKQTLYGSSFMPAYPIWLPEGSYTLRVAYPTSTSSSVNEIYCALSGIEFNVTP